MKQRIDSPFESDEEAFGVLEDMMDDGGTRSFWFDANAGGDALRPDWNKGHAGDPEKATLNLDGRFTVAELLAMIHFHPVLHKERNKAGPASKSDEVRILELASQKLTEQLNELLETIDPEKTQGKTLDQQYSLFKRAIMKARACLPAGYSMSLTKKKENNNVVREDQKQ